MRINGRTQRRGTGARDTRREEGVARNAQWAGLTTAQKVASLMGRRGGSARQMAKLGVAQLLGVTQ